MTFVGQLKRKIKTTMDYLENAIVPQTQHQTPDSMDKLSPTNLGLSMSSSLTSLRISDLKNIGDKTAHCHGYPSESRGITARSVQSEIVSTAVICTCHSESKYHVLWPATDGLDKHLSERTYDKLVSICGGSSRVDVFDSKDLGVIDWRVRLTQEEAQKVSRWPEILSPVGAPQECPARNEGSCKPIRGQYIAWGTEECWDDNDVAMRGARKLLDIVGHCSRMATHCREIAGNPSGVLYRRISILDEQIDAVESIPEIREIELADLSFDPHDVGIPIPNRGKRAIKPSNPRWIPRDVDLFGGRTASLAG